MRRHIGTLLSVGAVIASALWLLDPYYVGMLRAPWQEAWWAVLPDTIAGALRVWVFWGAATAVVAALLFRDTTIGAFDAVLLGALTLWIGSLLLGTLLGPFGLLRPWLLWTSLALGAASLLYRPPPRPRFSWTSGLRLTALAAAIVLPPMLLEQLGSPVPPHMDVFSPLAAAQRIVTFGYAPYANDPYGYYGRAADMPGLELFYAVLTLGSGVSTTALAATAVMLPMAALMILAVYRLGVTLVGDRCGGFATLLLMATMIFRVLPYAHGRYVAFVPALAGLAYVVDAHPVRRVAGGLLLGLAVACHAIVGAFAMATALVGGLPLVLGASLVAFPTALVTVGPPLPPLALSAVHAAGVALLVAAALGWRPPAIRGLSWLTGAAGRAALLGLALVLVRRPAGTILVSFAECWRFPLVMTLGVAGAVVLACTRQPARRLLLAAMSASGIVAAYLADRVTIPGLPWAAHDFSSKAEFWIPVALCFPAAAGLAWLSRWSVRAVTIPLVALLVIPWGPRVATVLAAAPCARTAVRDPNYNAVAWSEAVSEYVEFAKSGYWHPRWAQTPTELNLNEILRGEIAAGRITATTHLVHVSPFLYLYKDTLLFSVFDGIYDDPYIADYAPDPSIVGGRIRPIQDVAAVIASERPPYVVIHERTQSGQALDPASLAGLPLEGYEVLLDDDGVRLLRRRGA